MNRRTFLKSVPALAVLAAAESGFGPGRQYSIQLRQRRQYRVQLHQGVAADNTFEARDGRRQIRSGGHKGKKDYPQHQSRETSAADAV